MSKRLRFVIAILAIISSMQAFQCHAQETENHGIRIIPASGKVTIDGKIDDWDLSGGTFACGDVKRFRDHFSVWLHLMYDADNLYILARWKDPTPLNNPQSSRSGYGFRGDCLQVRFDFNYGKQNERVSHLTAWRDKDKILIAGLVYGRDLKGGKISNITDQGGKHAVDLVKNDPSAYNQEIAIPWKMIAPDGWKPENGEKFKITVEPNFTAGKMGRITIKDLLYNPMGHPDRVFTFTSNKDWGIGTIVDKAPVKPQALVMASDDTFKVSMKDGKPVVDWTPLLVKKELPGHINITFDMPFGGRVSLIIKNKSGEIVRHLLNDVPYQKGKHTVKWDGLATPMWHTPTDIIPAGEYSWEAIAHKPYKLTLHGWADCHGIPWNSTEKTGWGGDHGKPSCVARYKDTMLLGWSRSEAGYGLICVNKQGDKLWNLAVGPTGRAVFRLAVDGDEAFGFAKNVFKFSPKNGDFGKFGRNGKAFVYSRELWKDAKAPKGECFPTRNDSMDAMNGKIYLGYADPGITEDHVADWKKVVSYLLGNSANQKAMFTLVTQPPDKRTEKRRKNKFKAFIAGKKKLRDFAGYESPKRILGVINNNYLNRTDLVTGTENMTYMARRKANRAWVENEMPGCFKKVRTDFIVYIDENSGKTLGYFDIPAPTFIKTVNKDLLYVISDYKTILAVNPQTGKYKSILKAKDLKAITLDPKGNLVVARGGDNNQVVVYDPKGPSTGSGQAKELRRIGIKGGRPVTGKWQKNGMRHPNDVCFDSSNRLWVMEKDFSPKCVSVWNYKTGKNVDEFFGPTAYGASGACINPLNPNIMISSGVEYKLDEKGRAHAQQVISPEYNTTYSTYAMPANGRLYWVRARKWSPKVPQTIEIFEKLKDGSYVLRSSITWKSGDHYAKVRKTSFWSDKNDNAKRDPGETITIPQRLNFVGQWWLNMDIQHLTLIGQSLPWERSKEKAKVYEYKVTSYTKCGAPVWNVEKPRELLFTYLDGNKGEKIAQAPLFGNMQPSLNNKFLLSNHGGSRFGSRAMLECFDLKTGKRLWWYPNMWGHVHRGHHAPPGEPGLLRAVYGMIGQFEHPVVGNVWILNTDKGEWHMLSDSGFYIGTLFNGDVMSQKFPKDAVIGADMSAAPPGSGSEDFGGSVIQSKDGKVHVQSGKIGAWNIALGGLDSIKRIGSGKITIKPEEIALAKKEYERQKQGAVGKKMMIVEKKTVNFTGNLHRDFRTKPIKYKKSYNTRVSTYVAYDDKNLYLGYDVHDPTPWVNGAGEVVAMYQCGDTVDMQIGTDPKSNRKRDKATKGDLRISIGNFKGKPTAVLYRKVWNKKKPREFTSGVIKSYIMDYVDVLDSAKINVKVNQKAKKYILEAAIPLADLGLTPNKTAFYKADFGVTHGDPAGQRTRLRTYWSNQQTGLVADAVFELMMKPKNWGEIKFK